MPGVTMPDVIVILPGILGSVLEKNGHEVWGFSAGAGVRAIASLGGSIQDLELRADPDEEADIGDHITAPRVLPDVHMIPGFWKIDGYTTIAKSIKKVFAVTPGQNYFEFPYDWRRQNRVAALRLERQAKEWLYRWRASGHPNARLILIGHSMGGLIARYFLEARGGWEMTRTLITFGTPHRGAVNALNFIANGWRKTMLGATLLDLSALLRSLTSVYELLPTYKCCQQGGEMKHIKDVPIPHLDIQRLAKAAQFHADIAEGVDKRGRDFDNRVHPVVGTLQPTLQSARLENGVLEALASFEGVDNAGDGTVPRVSATPLELSDAGRDMFAPERHASLQNNDSVWGQVEGILRTGQIDLAAFRLPLVQLTVQMDDAYTEDEPVRIMARGDAEDTPRLSGIFTRLEDGKPAAPLNFTAAEDGWQKLDAGPLERGTYRVTVYGDARVRPVTDVFLVA
ncbi:MAG: hypothetical protein JO249_22850 [Acidobacteria bacterium]|nr:hypothetical protein [Acidobacteriota bacterium]